MSLKYMLYEVQDNVAILTFNRPEALNALSPEVVADLGAALDQAAADPEVRVIVLTGAGEKAFVAGADIKVMSQYSPLQAKNFAVWGQAIVNKLGTIPQPVIACVNGFALGGGCEIALACDFIYAADTAKFGQPEIGLGIIPGFGGTQRLTRRVGLGWAKELCLSGVMISAAEAKEIGLVNRVFPKDKLMEETLKTARIIAAKGRVALREAKTAVEQGFDMDLWKALAMEADRFTICFTSPDQKEGMDAFIEKRKPEFKGQL